MQPVIKQEMPCFRLELSIGRAIDRSFDYRDKTTHQEVHVIRKCAQGTFVDACGCPAICACLPISDWDMDISILERQKVALFVSDFQMSNDGVNVIRFCGYEILESPKKQ